MARIVCIYVVAVVQAKHLMTCILCRIIVTVQAKHFMGAWIVPVVVIAILVTLIVDCQGLNYNRSRSWGDRRSPIGIWTVNGVRSLTMHPLCMQAVVRSVIIMLSYALPTKHDSWRSIKMYCAVRN